MKKISAIFILFFTLDVCRAQSSGFVTLFNRVSWGRYCYQVGQKDLDQVGYCRKKTFFQSYHDLYNQTVFQRSAERQVEKNDCVAGQLQSIMKNTNNMQTWEGELLSAWMGQKKAQLVYQKCMEYLYSETQNTNHEYLRSKNQYFGPASPKLNPKWGPICHDPKTIQAMAAAPGLYAHNLPVASSSTFFDIVDSDRASILSAKTGKPLTDEEILNTDISGDLGITVSNDNLMKDIKDEFNAIVENRQKVTKKIKQAWGPQSAVTEGERARLQNYMVMDGTALEVLAKSGSIPPEGVGDPSNPEVSSGAACLLSSYLTNNKAELTEFGVTSVLLGGVARVGKLYAEGAEITAEELIRQGAARSVFRQANLLKKATTLAEDTWGGLQANFKVGAAYVGYPMFAQSLFKDCIRDKIKTTSPPLGGSDDDLLNKMVSTSLPKDMNYQRWKLDEDIMKKSCKNPDDQSQVFGAMDHWHCTKDALMTLIPMRIAVPLSIFGDETRVHDPDNF